MGTTWNSSIRIAAGAIRSSMKRSRSPNLLREPLFTSILLRPGVYTILSTNAPPRLRIIALPVAASDIERLEAIQRVHSRAVASADLRAVFYSNLEFHRALFSLCGNPYLIESIEQLAQKAYGIRSWSNTIPEYLQRVKRDHLDMLDALRRGRRAELVRLCRRHLAPSRDVYIRVYQQRFGSGVHRTTTIGDVSALSPSINT